MLTEGESVIECKCGRTEVAMEFVVGACVMKKGFV